MKDVPLLVSTPSLSFYKAYGDYGGHETKITVERNGMVRLDTAWRC
jgi:hypothetical protein